MYTHTGQVGWGVAYYINSTLVPELVLQRDRTYTFVVEAGNNPDDPANFHPFYITDSIHGSILFKSPEDQKVEDRNRASVNNYHTIQYYYQSCINGVKIVITAWFL